MYEKIILGKDENNQDIVWINKPFNITLIFGESGSGKSVLSKIIACESWYNPSTKDSRRIVIFDLKGDYVQKRGNYEYGIRNSNRSKGIYRPFNCSVIRYWRPHLSEVTREDFLALGMTDRGALLMEEILPKYKQIHNYEPRKLIKLLKIFPTTKRELTEFNEKHPSDEQIEFPKDSQTVMAALNILQANKGAFLKTKKNYDLYTRVLEDNIIFIPPESLQMKKRLMRFYYGMISRIIGKALYELHGMIIVEEADWLMPAPFQIEAKERENLPPIVGWFNSLINKNGRRFGISSILITQHEGLLNPLVGSDEAVHYIISGRVRADKKFADLKFNLETGIREFKIINFMENWSSKFTPKEPGSEV